MSFSKFMQFSLHYAPVFFSTSLTLESSHAFVQSVPTPAFQPKQPSICFPCSFAFSGKVTETEAEYEVFGIWLYDPCLYRELLIVR